MPRLVVNPDTTDAWVIELGPGTISLGRSSENDYVIEHFSVSSSHCQVTTSECGTWVKDLGSTAGTYVDNILTEGTRLNPGQRLRLGEIELRFESDTAPMATVPQEPPIPRRAYPQMRPAPQKQPVSASFLSSVLGSFAYPFKGSGVFMLLAGTVFFFLLGWMPLLGLILAGYFFNYAKSIVVSSAQGEPAPPDWPDFGDWKDDILVPYFHLLVLVAFFFGPAYLIGLFHPGNAAVARVMYITALGFGALLLPMAMLALAMFDTIGALNPISLTWSIARVPLPYLLAATMFNSVLVLHVLAENALAHAISIPILPSLLSSFVYLYLIAVGMRILGLLYLHNRQRLGWFNR